MEFLEGEDRKIRMLTWVTNATPVQHESPVVDNQLQAILISLQSHFVNSIIHGLFDLSV